MFSLSVSPPPSTDLFKSVVAIMSRHSEDHRPHSYAVWYAYVLGDPSVTTALDHAIGQFGTVDMATIDRVYDDQIAAGSVSGESTVASIGDLFGQVSQDGEKVLAGATEMFNYVKKAADDLDDAQREQLLHQLVQMTHNAGRIKNAMTMSRAILEGDQQGVSQDAGPAPSTSDGSSADESGESDDLADFVFEMPLAANSPAAPTSVLEDLHACCADVESPSKTVLMCIAIDRLGRDPAQDAADIAGPLSQQVLIRASKVMSSQVKLGVLENYRVLAILSEINGDTAEDWADEICESFQSQSDDALGVGSVSVSVTPLYPDDLPDGVVGRLGRSLLRSQLRGGGKVDPDA